MNLTVCHVMIYELIKIKCKIYIISFLLPLIYFFITAYYTTSIDYNLYATPKKGVKHGQSNLVREEAVNSGMNQINDKVNKYMHQKHHNALTMIAHNT